MQDEKKNTNVQQISVRLVKKQRQGISWMNEDDLHGSKCMPAL